MQTSKRHHSVPMHYLERFTGDTGLLWVYPTDGAEPRQAHPRNTAVERYLYAPEVGDNPKTDEVEKFLAEHVDGPASQPLAKLSIGEDLTPEERNSVAIFLAFQELRVPQTRDAILGFVEQIGHRVLEMVVAHPEHLDKKAAEIGLRGELVRRGYEGIKAGDLKLEATKISWLDSMLQVARESANLIDGLSWCVAECSPGFEFVTSDTPVVKILTDRSVPAIYAGGWISPSAESTFALDPEHVLIIKPDGPTGRIAPPRAWCIDVNRRTVGQAHRFVISRNRADWITKQLGRG